MNQWNNRPSRDRETTCVPVVRTRPGRGTGGIVLSNDVIGAYTHFWKNRTCICTKPECDACNAGRIGRWYGYITIMNAESKERAILEITPACMEPLDAYYTQYGTLRGSEIRLARVSAKQNARLAAQIKKGPYTDDKLPPDLDVQQFLEKMWEVAATKFTATKASQHDETLLHEMKGRSRITNGQASKGPV